MTEFPLSRRKKWAIRSELSIPDKKYLEFEQDPETGLVPYESPKPLVILPKAAANFELLAAGRSPFLIVPEGTVPRPQTRQLAYELLHNLDSADAWENLLIEKESTGVDVYVVSHHNQRYILKKVEVGYGGEDGILHLQPVGAPLGQWIQIPISQIIMRGPDGNPQLALLPVILYR